MARPRRPLSSFRLQRVMERSSPDHGAVIPPFYAGGVLVRETTAHSPPQYAGLDMSTQKEKENTSMAQALTYTLESTSGSKVMAVDSAASTVARGAGAVGLAAIALIHVLDAPGTYVDHPYIFF